MATKKIRKAKRATTPPATTAKSASVRLLATPEQVATWQRAANISHEGNLSMFLRGAADDRACAVIEIDGQKASAP